MRHPKDLLANTTSYSVGATDFSPKERTMPPCLRAPAVKMSVFAGDILGLAACGFGDLFRTAGPRDVTITFVGDSSLFVGDTAAFTIVVTANGMPVANPNLTIASSDTTIFTINAARDSLRAIGNGNARLTARLNDSAFTDSLPTLSIRIRVRG